QNPIGSILKPKKNISTNDDIQKGLKGSHQIVSSEKGRKKNEQEIQNRIEHNDDEDDEEYNENEGTELLQNLISPILKPKNNISTNDDIQQGLKRGHQMVSSRKGRKKNKQEIQ
ncbi:unnamed protein product, partial [Rotaria sp. Silwood1]